MSSPLSFLLIVFLFFVFVDYDVFDDSAILADDPTGTNVVQNFNATVAMNAVEQDLTNENLSDYKKKWKDIKKKEKQYSRAIDSIGKAMKDLKPDDRISSQKFRKLKKGEYNLYFFLGMLQGEREFILNQMNLDSIN
ncbi:hypothetical protein BDB01DRAFT_895985 [Pilobolus umbonatus]|nr:hypothetical protein BDB01DRAFT_895985 [Pilobolus umbonatus]